MWNCSPLGKTHRSLFLSSDAFRHKTFLDDQLKFQVSKWTLATRGREKRALTFLQDERQASTPMTSSRPRSPNCLLNLESKRFIRRKSLQARVQTSPSTNETSEGQKEVTGPDARALLSLELGFKPKTPRSQPNTFPLPPDGLRSKPLSGDPLHACWFITASRMHVFPLRD